MNISASHLAELCSGRLESPGANQPLTGASIDTRTLKTGDAFFALAGPRFDGHDFLKAAIEKGAKALVVHRPIGALTLPSDVGLIRVPETLAALQRAGGAYRREMPATVIGLTGSNGKTTTKEMLASILRQVAPTLATSGNLNNHIGLPLTLLRLEPHHRYAVIEMGTSMPGDMDLLAQAAGAQVGLITNVGQDHLEFFGTPEGVLDENWKLYERLPDSALAVINQDDPLIAARASRLHGRTLRYSMQTHADVSARDIRAWPWPLRFTLRLDGTALEVTLPVVGTVQVLNALAAATVAFGLGIRAEAIQRGLAEFTPAPMRMQVHRTAGGAILVNDAYNANPSSMGQSVESFCASFPDYARWAVLGDMRELGTGARHAHETLGRWLADQPLERVFLYGRDTRFIESALRQKSSRMPVERFHKKRYLLDALQKSLSTQKPAILFKASRRLKLETLVQELVR